MISERSEDDIESKKCSVASTEAAGVDVARGSGLRARAARAYKRVRY